MWGTPDAFSKRPGDVRDTWCIPQKTADVRGLLILYSYYLPMPMTTHHWLLLLQAIYYCITSPFIIDYCYPELCTTTLHHYLSLIIFTLSHVLVHNDKDNNTRRNLTDVCNWPLLYPLPKSILQKASTSIYRAKKKRERYIETKIMFWEFEGEIPSHCSYTERSKL